MLQQLGELKVNRHQDWDSSIVKALEAAGFAVMHKFDGMVESEYIIAKVKDDDKRRDR